MNSNLVISLNIDVKFDITDLILFLLTSEPAGRTLFPPKVSVAQQTSRPLFLNLNEARV